jgi:hypothetical protein
MSVPRPMELALNACNAPSPEVQFVRFRMQRCKDNRSIPPEDPPHESN